jgi:porin
VRAAGDLPARTGAVQIPNNEWAPDFLRLYQLSYRQQLGAAAVRVGIMDFSQYFDANEQAALLQNSSFGPAANFTNVQAPTFPNPGLGAMAEYRFNPQWSARAGVWQGDPPGLRAVFRRGALWLGELAHDGPTGGQGSPPSVLKLGVWHESQRDPAVGPATSGAYLVGERRWTRGARQWGSFVLAGTSPSQPNLVTQFLAAGFVVTGPWAGRPQDRLSLGVSRVNLRAPAPETVLEAVYSWQLSPRLALQPDVQRFWHPGGGEPGTVVAGLRLCWEAAP